MTLYFKDKETNLAIPFPPSILALSSDRFYRKYAISTVDGIDNDKNE